MRANLNTKFLFLISSGIVFFLAASSMIYAGYLGYSSTPMYDQWDQFAPERLIAEFFLQHNEHRISVSRLVFLVDDFFVQGDGRINLFFVFLFQIGAYLVILNLLFKSVPALSAAEKFIIVVISSVIFFDGFQFENFVSGFQHGFTGVYFFAYLSIYLLIPKKNDANWIRILSCGLAALLSAYSMANGLLILIINPILAALFGYGRRQIVFLVAEAVLVWALYFYGYNKAVGHGSLTAAFSHPVELGAFLFSYLGASVTTNISQYFSILNQINIRHYLSLGLGVVISATLYALARRSILTKSAALYALCGACLFVLGSASLTALGRFELGPVAAYSNRYGTATAGLISIVFSLLIIFTRQSSTVIRNGAYLFVTIALGFIIINQPSWYDVAEDFGIRKRMGAAALMADVNDDEILSLVYPGRDHLKLVAAEARKLNLLTFSQPWTLLYGEKINFSQIPAGLKDCKLHALMRTRLNSDTKFDQLLVVPEYVGANNSYLVLNGEDIVSGYLIYGSTYDRRKNIFSPRHQQPAVLFGYAPREVEHVKVLGVSAAGDYTCASAETL